MKRWEGGCMGDESDILRQCLLGDLESTPPFIICILTEIELGLAEKQESKRVDNAKRGLRMVFIYMYISESGVFLSFAVEI